MKTSMLFLAFMLVGCTGRSADMANVDARNLSLKAGQTVHVKDIKFYELCDGVISGYHPYYDRNDGIYSYKVDLFCGEAEYMEAVTLPEGNLVPFERPKQ